MAGLQDYVHEGIQLYHRQVLPFLWPLRRAITDVALPILNVGQSFFSSKPDLSSLALLLVVLILSFKLLDMVRRTVLSWVVLLTKLVFWCALVLLCLAAWQQGPDVVLSSIWSWLSELSAFFQNEMERWNQATSPAPKSRTTATRW